MNKVNNGLFFVTYQPTNLATYTGNAVGAQLNVFDVYASYRHGTRN